jgi:hypothetical protein
MGGSDVHKYLCENKKKKSLFGHIAGQTEKKGE